MSRHLDRIRVDAETCHGQPRVAGTRIMVHLVLELLETLSPGDIIRDHYPQLTPQDIEACRSAELPAWNLFHGSRRRIIQ